VITVREAVAEMKADYPGLCVHGLANMGTPAPATLTDVVAEARRWPQLIQLCRSWLSQCPQIANIRSERDTYTYKNEIEVWSGVSWVPHIAVLVAARQLGIPMEQNPNRPYAALLPLGAKRP
jgi:hypothetical protein